MSRQEFATTTTGLSAILFALLLLAGSAWAQHEQAFPFNGSNGSNPQGGLIADAAGNLYGATFYGGSANSGVVFEMSPPVALGGRWTETTLYSFTGENGTGDGQNPSGDLTLDNAGNLYGTTSSGECLRRAPCSNSHRLPSRAAPGLRL